MSGCVYTSLTGSAFGLVQLLPWAIPTAVTLFSWSRSWNGKEWGFEFTPFWYSFYLSLCQFIIYILQMSVNSIRADPFCSNILGAAFPSSATFMVVAVISFFVFSTFIHNAVFSWTYWLWALVIFIIPPSVLIWVQYNEWWEVLTSAALAVVANIAFLIWLHFCVKPELPFILNSFPCNYFKVKDSILMDSEQLALTEQLKDELEQVERKLPWYVKL